MKLILYKPKTVMGKFIKFLSPFILGKSAKYSHVGIVLDNYHILDINAGQNSKIRHVHNNRFNFSVITINLSYNQKTLFYKSISKYLDLEYDYLKAIDVFNNDKKYTCYELVNLILYDIEYLDKMYDIKLPEELVEVLMKGDN